MTTLKIANIHFNLIGTSKINYSTANVIEIIANTNGANVTRTTVEPRQSNTITLGSSSSPFANPNFNKIVFGNNVVIEKTSSNLVFRGAGEKFSFDKPINENTLKAPTFQIFTSSGTWSKPTGCRYIKVSAQGAGGGGGAANTIGSGTGNMGGGGGAGSFGIKWLDVSNWSNSTTVTVGSGGTGPGNVTFSYQGTTSSFGTHLTSPGGEGGKRGSGGANFKFSDGGGAQGNNTVSIGGDINLYGSPGQPGWRTGADIGNSGLGGLSIFGGGAINYRAFGTTVNNQDNGAYGGGGGGRVSMTANAAGGTGGNGIVVVEEFY